MRAKRGCSDVPLLLFSAKELAQVRQQIFPALLNPIVWICFQMGDEQFYERFIWVFFQNRKGP